MDGAEGRLLRSLAPRKARVAGDRNPSQGELVGSAEGGGHHEAPLRWLPPSLGPRPLAVLDQKGTLSF